MKNSSMLFLFNDLNPDTVELMTTDNHSGHATLLRAVQCSMVGLPRELTSKRDLEATIDDDDL